MNQRQIIICRLLAELRDICEESKIRYYLTGWTALSTFVKGTLEDKVRYGQMMIWASDAKKLVEAVAQRKREDRMIDYLGNNDDFPGFFMRYTAKDTTQFELYHDNGYHAFGIGVDILFVNYLPKNPVTQRKLELLELGLFLRNGIRQNLNIKEKIALQTAKTYMTLFKKSGKAMFDYMLKLYSRSTEQILCRVKHVPRFEFTGPANMLDAPVTCYIEEEPFLLPGNPKSFLKSMYGKYYVNFLEEGIKYPTTIENPDLPYEDLFREINAAPVEYIRKQEKRNSDFNEVYFQFRDGVQYYRVTWDRLKVINNAVSLRDFYDEDCMKRIRKYHESGDYRALYELIGPYLTHVAMCAKRNLSGPDYAVNEELDTFIRENRL